VRADQRMHRTRLRTRLCRVPSIPLTDTPPHVLTRPHWLPWPPTPSGSTATIDDLQFRHQTSSIPNSNTLNSGDAAPWSTAARPFVAHALTLFTSARPRIVSCVSLHASASSYRHRLYRQFLNLPSNQVMENHQLPLGDLVIPEFYYCRWRAALSRASSMTYSARQANSTNLILWFFLTLNLFAKSLDCD
jgi:hypothetical protein